GEHEGVAAPEAGATEPDGERPDVVVARIGQLTHQPDTDQAHQVTMRLGGRHAGRGREVAQHERGAGIGEDREQAATRLDGVDAPAAGSAGLRIAGASRSGTDRAGRDGAPGCSGHQRSLDWWSYLYRK